MDISYPTIAKLRKIPPEELEIVLKWIDQGQKAIAILEKYHVRITSAITLWRVFGLDVSNRPVGRYPKISQDKRQAIMDDYSSNMLMDEITTKHGVHRCTVWAIRRETNTPPRCPAKTRRRGPKPSHYPWVGVQL